MTSRFFFSSQFLATTIESVLLIGCGFCMVFAGIIIPALTGIPNKHNLNESLSLSSTQASWLGKAILLDFLFKIHNEHT